MANVRTYIIPHSRSLAHTLTTPHMQITPNAPPPPYTTTPEPRQPPAHYRHPAAPRRLAQADWVGPTCTRAAPFSPLGLG